MPAFTRDTILHLLESLNAELAIVGVAGKVYLTGGAVMCLAFDARDSTKDVDAVCKPSGEIRAAVIRVAEKEGVTDHWLNDAVKGFVSDRGSFQKFLELSNLTVLCADARYMLAMKCLAMRLGEGYRDEDDVRYLLKNLGIEDQ